MAASFPFEKRPSRIFGTVHRPVAPVSFWSRKTNSWTEVFMVIDTGADYTMLPRYWANNLGISLENEAIPFITSGVGGQTKTFFIKSWRVKLNSKELSVPLGFLDQDNVPPLLGRQNFLELVSVTFNKHVTTFNF